jgi:hypothetical protein
MTLDPCDSDSSREGLSALPYFKGAVARSLSRPSSTADRKT